MRYATFMLFAAVAGLAIAEDIALDDNAITTMVKGKRLGATRPPRVFALRSKTTARLPATK